MDGKNCTTLRREANECVIKCVCLLQSSNGRVQNEDRRPKTQKRRPLQNRLEITLKWFERVYRPTQKRETARLRLSTNLTRVFVLYITLLNVQNEDPLKIVLKSLQNGSNVIVDQSRNEKQQLRFAFINKFDQGLRFVHNPTKCTKRRPPQNRLEITSKWFERDCRPKQKRETTIKICVYQQI